MKTNRGILFVSVVVLAAAVFTLVGCSNSSGGLSPAEEAFWYQMMNAYANNPAIASSWTIYGFPPNPASWSKDQIRMAYLYMYNGGGGGGGSGGNTVTKPAPLANNATIDEAIAKLDEIIAYCDSHSGNTAVRSSASGMKTNLETSKTNPMYWTGAQSATISTINNNYIGALQ
jgi:hypothetical protein